MSKLSCFLLFLIVLVAVVQLSEGGRGRWRQRRRHGKQRDRPSWFSRRREDHHRGRSHGWRHHHEWKNGNGETGFRSGSSSHHSFDFLDSQRNPFLSFDFSWGSLGLGPDPWWKGPNVCESETVETSNTTETGDDFIRHFSRTSRTCDETETAYRCKETTETLEGKRVVTMVKECCHGFSRKEEDIGCPNELEMQNLMDKASALGLSDFVRAVRLLRLERELREGNFTVFAPINGAFGLDSNLINAEDNILIQDEPNVIMMSEPSAERALESLQDGLLGHLVVGTLRTSAMEDEQVLETASPEGSTIRINYFVVPHKVTTANCVPMESKDHMASNGIIHTLSNAMRPVTKSILDVVKSSPELSTLKTVLAAANYVSKLDQEEAMTLLAPTNKAFETMDSRLRERLLRGDRKCLEKVLRNHILPNVICMSAVKGQAKTPNKLHEYVNLTRSEDDKLFADGAQVVQQDLMATNGVIHLIDTVLVPKEALSILDVLRQEGYDQLLDLLEQADLTKTIDTAENLTLFAPTNEAIQNLPESLKSRLTSDRELLKEVLSFHASPGVQECKSFHNNDFLPSLAGPDIRLNRFNTFSRFSVWNHQAALRTAQCAPFSTKHTLEACNGHVTVLDDVMIPPQGNVIDVLALDKRFSTLVSLVKQSGLADALQEDGPFTIFAPNNEAFEKVDRRDLEEIAEDTDRLQRLLKGHVFGNTLCCAGIVKETWYSSPRVRTLAGDYVKLRREHDGELRVGSGKVLQCDRTATNGNILEIDQVLMDDMPRRWMFKRRRPYRWSGFRRRFEP